jgi:protein gp37
MGTEQYIGTTLGGKFHGIVNCVPKALDMPLRWKKPQMVAVALMGDLFHEKVPTEFIAKVFVIMSLCQQHTFQVLTKRPERMAEVCAAHPWFAKVLVSSSGKESAACSYQILPNVWLGTSVENQATANERIPHLLKCPAVVRFLSVEPMLGAIDLDSEEADQVHALGCGNSGCECGDRGVDWVIVGGESGPGARPMHPDWARGIRDQCQAAGVPFFFKQWGGVNKKRTGRVLDGRTWDEMPATAKRKD